jgi:transcriptional regulator with XRE-family HTH domain
VTDGGGGPLGSRRALGAALRSLREAAGKSVDDAMKVLDCSQSKISRLETGRAVPRLRDVRDLLEAYGVPGDEQQLLLDLVDGSKASGWWEDYRDVTSSGDVPEHLQRLIALENEASVIRSFEPDFIPGLLQTEEYIRAVQTELHKGMPAEKLERNVEFRLARAKSLHRRQSGLDLEFVVGELAVQRAFVGSDVLANQLEWLIENFENGLGYVDFRILPNDVAIFDGVGGPFLTMDFPRGAEHSLVYLEGREGATYRESSDDVRNYDRAFANLQGNALSRSDSIKRLAELVILLRSDDGTD